jgi:hypothetical protein
MTDPSDTELDVLADPEALTHRVAAWMLEAAPA